MRKAPTEEQKRAAAERRERFRGLAKTVSEMSDAQRAELLARIGAVVTVEGRPLSVHNSCLLVSQLPTVSVVAGFRQWLSAGRSVKKGSRALSLWIPAGNRKDEPDGITGDEKDASGRPPFIMGSVFDISQTEPAEVPAMA